MRKVRCLVCHHLSRTRLKLCSLSTNLILSFLAYGAKDLEDFMTSFWEAWALSKDPENLLVMLYTWQAGDCSKQEPYNGDFEAAMGAIKAKALVMPAKTDLYFP